jgi:hypothetical protein
MDVSYGPAGLSAPAPVVTSGRVGTSRINPRIVCRRVTFCGALGATLGVDQRTYDPMSLVGLLDGRLEDDV